MAQDDQLMISFVATAEKSVSNYRFGVYDILFLPDSFPYGGEQCDLISVYATHLTDS